MDRKKVKVEDTFISSLNANSGLALILLFSVLRVLDSGPADLFAETTLMIFYLSFLELCLVNCCFALTLSKHKNSEACPLRKHVSY